MSKDKEKKAPRLEEWKELVVEAESRNRKIARAGVIKAHFPPVDNVDLKEMARSSIDEQMWKAQEFGEETESIMEKGVFPGEEYKEPDPVNHPTHYNQFGIECLSAIEASMTPVEFRGYLKGNCQKYIWRYVYKGKPVEDLKKAAFYLNLLIEKVEDNGV